MCQSAFDGHAAVATATVLLPSRVRRGRRPPRSSARSSPSSPWPCARRSTWFCARDAGVGSVQAAESCSHSSRRWSPTASAVAYPTAPGCPPAALGATVVVTVDVGVAARADVSERATPAAAPRSGGSTCRSAGRAISERPAGRDARDALPAAVTPDSRDEPRPSPQALPAAAATARCRRRWHATCRCVLPGSRRAPGQRRGRWTCHRRQR